MKIEKLTELIGCKPEYIHIEGRNYYLDVFPYDNKDPCKRVYLDSIIIFIELILERYRSLEYPLLSEFTYMRITLYTLTGMKKEYPLRPDGDGSPSTLHTKCLEFCKSQGVSYKII